jgi:hypothetical protein
LKSTLSELFQNGYQENHKDGIVSQLLNLMNLSLFQYWFLTTVNYLMVFVTKR